MTTFRTERGSTLSYSRRGSGPLVVCVPGGPGMDPETYFAPLDVPVAETITAPALIVAGELDVTVPPEAMRLIADALPRATFVELGGVGHFVEVGAPDALGATVRGFLKG